MPPWTEVQADVDLVCKLHERLNDVYDVHAIDVVVVGIFHQASRCSSLLAFHCRPVCLVRELHERGGLEC